MTMTTLARRLRREQTDAEKVFWSRVRSRRLNGHKFRRQVWVGRHIADFICVERKLIVELDGGQHALRTREDEHRTCEFTRRRYTVVRYWNNDVICNIDGVLSDLLARLT